MRTAGLWGLAPGPRSASAREQRPEAELASQPHDRVAEDDVGEPDAEVAHDDTTRRPWPALEDRRAEHPGRVGIAAEVARVAVREELLGFVREEEIRGACDLGGDLRVVVDR